MVTFGIKTEENLMGVKGTTANSTTLAARPANIKTKNTSRNSNRVSSVAAGMSVGSDGSININETPEDAVRSIGSENINVVDTNELESSGQAMRLPSSQPSGELSFKSSIARQLDAIKNRALELKAERDSKSTKVDRTVRDEVDTGAAVKGGEPVGMSVNPLQSLQDEVYRSIVEMGNNELAIEAIEEEENLRKFQQERTEIVNKINQKELEFRRNIEKIQDAPGLTSAQKNAQINEIDRRQSREIADLEIIAMARQGRYQDAQANVDRKVDIMLAEKEANLQGLQFIYNENKERFTKLEDRQWQTMLMREERAYKAEYDKQKTLEELKLRMTINATEAGAGINTLEKIQGARNQEELFTLNNADRFLKSKAELMDEKIKQLNYQSALASLTPSSSGTFTLPDGRMMTQEDIDSAITKADKAKEIYDQITKLQQLRGKAGAVGFGIGKTINIFGDTPFAGTAAAGYTAEAERLIAMLSESNLGRLKGAMSDNDLKFIQKISTSLDRSMNEKTWDKELNRLLTEATIGYEEARTIPGLNLPPLVAGSETEADLLADEYTENITSVLEDTGVFNYENL